MRYFLAVVKEESISKAANYLHISQPTLSRQLMDLENELGSTLFIRGNKKITLTDEGFYLYKRAEEIIDLHDKTEATFHSNDEIISGDIYIGGAETKAMGLIAKTAYTLWSDYPGVKYHIFSGNADDVTGRLDKGLLDFGVLIEPCDLLKYDFLRLPHTEIWGLIMRKDSLLANKDSITTGELTKIPLIVSRQSHVKNDISAWLGKNADELNIIATYNLVFNATFLVTEGLGYALCIDGLINTTDENNLCFKPLYPVLNSNLVLVWKKHQVFTRAVDLFLNRLKMEILSE